MKKTSMILLSSIFVVMLISTLSGCSKVVENQTDKSSEFLYSDKGEKWKDLDESWNGQVMVDGELYFYTPYEVPFKIEKKDILGKVKSLVGNYQVPSKNGQANFDIKGSKYARYEENMAVLIDKEWLLFMNEENWSKGTSISYSGFLDESLGEEEALKLLRRIAFGLQMDNDYENNLDTIIEEAFRYCGIDDSSLLEEAKSDITVNVSDY